MPAGVFVDADGKGLHGPNGEPIAGILVQYEDRDEYKPNESPANWEGRAVVPAEEFQEEQEPDATESAQDILDEAGIPLENVYPGSGKDGRVTKPDAEKAVEALEEEQEDDEGSEAESEEGGESSGGDESPEDEAPGALEFASDEAAELFIEEDVNPHALLDLEPSGEDEEYTTDDVREAM